MIKFKKDFNLKVILVIVGLLVFLTNFAYSHSINKSILRFTLKYSTPEGKIRGVIDCLVFSLSNYQIKQKNYGRNPAKKVEDIIPQEYFDKISEVGEGKYAIRMHYDSEGIWIYNIKHNIYVVVSRNGEFSQKTEREFKNTETKRENSINVMPSLLILPKKIGRTLEEDVRNMIVVFNDQFGSHRVSYDNNPIAPEEKGIAVLHGESGTDRLFPTLQSEGMDKIRTVQVRIMAHEVQHAWNNNLDLRYLLSQVPAFQELQKRFEDRYDRVMEMDLDYRPFRREKEWYKIPDEILARLRSYQVFLQQVEQYPELLRQYKIFLERKSKCEVYEFKEVFKSDSRFFDNLATEFNEFLEILTPNDLIWLDLNYLKNVTKDLYLPRGKSMVITHEDIYPRSLNEVVTGIRRSGKGI